MNVDFSSLKNKIKNYVFSYTFSITQSDPNNPISQVVLWRKCIAKNPVGYECEKNNI
jgi:hypothetical protein